MFIQSVVYTFTSGIPSFAFLLLAETRHHIICVSSKAVPDFLLPLGKIQWLMKTRRGGRPRDSAQARKVLHPSAREIK